MKTKILAASLFAFGLLSALTVHADVAVIVHPSNSIEVISRTELTRIYLGRMKEFPGGGAATPVNQSADATVRVKLENDYLGKSPSQIHAYWAKQMFSGQGKPPEEVDSDASMIEAVKGDASAIGYVDAANVTGDVKVLTIN